MERCFMIHPDYIIGAVMVVIFAALLKEKINFEHNEQLDEEKPIFYRPMPFVLVAKP